MPDLTFITNEGENTLERRLAALLENAAAMDILVGYFRAGGFDRVSQHLKPDARVRVLVGMSADPETRRRAAASPALASSAQLRARCADRFADEMERSDDAPEVERGAREFLSRLADGRLEIRAHPEPNLHAKLYIFTFAPGDRDAGRVVTGSSNLTESGLARNLEFNVELKNAADHQFALRQFNELWAESADVSAACRDALQNRTWLRDDITPRELYLKFLREYFRAEFAPERADDSALPGGVMRLEYQRQAVRNAERIIASYGGVFLADVVGLGKTYMAAMLARRLGGHSVVVAPPAVLDPDSPGAWPAVFREFGLSFYGRSLGALDDIPRRETERCENIFVDEAHRFRSGGGVRYDRLAELCREKRVVLVTATPYNNKPDDILSLLSLFQPARASDIPGVPDLEKFFKSRAARIKKADSDARVRTARNVAAEIRRKVSRFVTVRRTRAEIAAHFPDDLRDSNLRFPKAEKPVPLFYQMDKGENAAFDAAVATAKKLSYARYRPLEYLKKPGSRPGLAAAAAEQNLVGLMKTLLVKRLESSFAAFRGTVDRFVESHRQFIRACERGGVYFSKRDLAKIMECIGDGDDARLAKLLDEGRARKIPADEFTPALLRDLRADLAKLQKLQAQWRGVRTDPKLAAFAGILQTNKVLRDGKIVVFTESTETAKRLADSLAAGGERVLLFYGGAGAKQKREVAANFDANAERPRDDFRILVATEALAEGVNLHAAHSVVNYDIPWNPTRLMQRAGRINRVGGIHDRIRIFNFFPTAKGEKQIGLQEKARVKIEAFVSLLGSDIRHLADDETVDSHRLFDLWNSAQAVAGEDPGDDESELAFLREIEKVRDEDPELFQRVERLPRKARTARPALPSLPGVPGDSNDPDDGSDQGALLTYFKSGELDKFFICRKSGETEELHFARAAAKLRADASVPRLAVPPDYFRRLAKNRAAFDNELADAASDSAAPRGRNAARLSQILAAVLSQPGLGKDARELIGNIADRLNAGALTDGVIRAALRGLQDAGEWNAAHPDSAADLLREIVPPRILAPHRAEKSRAFGDRPREVILSEFFAPVPLGRKAKTPKR